MVLMYNGKDITEFVDITGALCRDNSGGACDTLELTFENASAWYAWGPKKDDELEIIQDGYKTGKMYLNTVLPEEGKFNVIATAIPSTARTKMFMGYENMTISDIATACAIESGMGSTVWGIDPKTKYGYITRNGEACAAFLERIANMEGCVMKCWNGKYTLIDVMQAQKLQAGQVIEMTAETQGIQYTKRPDIRMKKLSIISAYGQYEAVDEGAEGSRAETRCDLPVSGVSDAVRWAKGLLLMNNRKSETLTINSVFNVGWTAMARIDVTGTTDANGSWLIDEVVHDFINETSVAKCLRVIDTIR